MRRSVCTLLFLLLAARAWADIPATPVMTVYQFNGSLDVPYYDVDAFQRSGKTAPAGSLSQGTSLIPCLVIRGGEPLTDSSGTPYVGFQIVVDARTATPASTEQFQQAVSQRKALRVENHHCAGSIRHVIDARRLYALEKAPFFDPPAAPGARGSPTSGQGELDAIVRAFHNSPECNDATRDLIGRRSSLQRAWDLFIRAHRGDWSSDALDRARHLDYAMRTAIFEGHLDRGCNAYGGCERNIIALSIRNRARGECRAGQGCDSEGDFTGVSSKVSQYNIWDEFLTQTSGLTSCFLRDDLGSGARGGYYAKLRAMYEQSAPTVQRILFGEDRDLVEIFPGHSAADLKTLRHYYHPPAMGKCFPNHEWVGYITGAVARRGSDFALLANTRIRVDERAEGGYRFRSFTFEAKDDRDAVEIVDRYPGFVIDESKVDLKAAPTCPPYGIPPGCPFAEVGRYRTTPPWLRAGQPLELTCRVKDSGANCRGPDTLATVRVGGVCDTQMRPVARVR
jgi:hypothetical protein